MKLIQQFIDFFKLSDTEKEIVTNEVGQENIRRVFYISIMGILTIALYFIFFDRMEIGADDTARQWYFSVITILLVFLLTYIIVSLFLYFFSYRPPRYNKVARASISAITLLFLIGGVAFASVDQLITSAITPYMLTCLATGLLLLIRPLQALLYYVATYIVFYYVLSMVQPNHDILISNLGDAFYATAIGLCLSFFLWRGSLIRIKQSRLIKKQNIELSESNAAKDKFFSIIAHDLKSPFSSVLGLSRIMKEEMEEKETENTEKYIRLINSSIENIYKLLENLLEWARSQTGNLDFKPDNINLTSIIKEKIEEFSVLAEAKNISLYYFQDSDLFIYADKNMLKTILRNLIANAIKFTQAGGKVEMITMVKPRHVEISVSDNGIGIAEEIKDQLFELSSTKIRRGTAKENGTGLGLILCKEFVEKQGGKIWAESNAEKGCQFKFTLPLSAVESL